MGGGEPDAAEMREEGLRGTGGGRDGSGEGLEGGEEAKGLGEGSESMLVTVVGGQWELPRSITAATPPPLFPPDR